VRRSLSSLHMGDMRSRMPKPQAKDTRLLRDMACNSLERRNPAQSEDTRPPRPTTQAAPAAHRVAKSVRVELLPSGRAWPICNWELVDNQLLLFRSRSGLWL
jgi:hypothetical protein